MSESPLRDIMIEIITHERIGLPTIQAAGDVIAADAAMNLRGVAAGGGATLAARMDAMQQYEAEIERADKAWLAFKDASGRANAFDPAPNEALERALNEVRRGLDQIDHGVSATDSVT